MKQAFTRVLHSLRADGFFKVLLVGLLVLGVLSPTRPADYGALVDWSTISALAGLLLLTKGLELSGVLQRLGHRLVAAMATERAVALSLVLAAAALSTVLTNDVALFVVVPLTLGVCRITGTPATRLVVFEALAVNAGSALTPIGNPQNLFLWQLARVSFGEFVLHQLPLVAGLMLALVALTMFAFTSRPMQVTQDEAEPLDARLLALCLALYLPFLVAADMGQAPWGLVALLVLLTAVRPRVALDLDWGLLLVFVLMFVDLRLLAQLPAVRQAMAGLGLDHAVHLYAASIGASQVISNVPAAIALAEYSRDWRVIAYGVNVGGFGLMVGSLANLIALRMSGDTRAWRSFHVYGLPALAVAALLGYALLFL